jgi:hypothetical protein
MLTLIQKSELQLWLGGNNSDFCAIRSIVTRVPEIPFHLGLLQMSAL